MEKSTQSSNPIALPITEKIDELGELRLDARVSILKGDAHFDETDD